MDTVSKGSIRSHLLSPMQAKHLGMMRMSSRENGYGPKNSHAASKNFGAHSSSSRAALSIKQGGANMRQAMLPVEPSCLFAHAPRARLLVKQPTATASVEQGSGVDISYEKVTGDFDKSGVT